jgi:hypothetical protein
MPPQEGLQQSVASGNRSAVPERARDLWTRAQRASRGLQNGWREAPRQSQPDNAPAVRPAHADAPPQQRTPTHIAERATYPVSRQEHRQSLQDQHPDGSQSHRREGNRRPRHDRGGREQTERDNRRDERPPRDRRQRQDGSQSRDRGQGQGDTHSEDRRQGRGSRQSREHTSGQGNRRTGEHMQEQRDRAQGTGRQDQDPRQHREGDRIQANRRRPLTPAQITESTASEALLLRALQRRTADIASMQQAGSTPEEISEREAHWDRAIGSIRQILQVPGIADEQVPAQTELQPHPTRHTPTLEELRHNQEQLTAVIGFPWRWQRLGMQEGLLLTVQQHVNEVRAMQGRNIATPDSLQATVRVQPDQTTSPDIQVQRRNLEQELAAIRQHRLGREFNLHAALSRDAHFDELRSEAQRDIERATDPEAVTVARLRLEGIEQRMVLASQMREQITRELEMARQEEDRLALLLSTQSEPVPTVQAPLMEADTPAQALESSNELIRPADEVQALAFRLFDTHLAQEAVQSALNINPNNPQTLRRMLTLTNERHAIEQQLDGLEQERVLAELRAQIADLTVQIAALAERIQRLAHPDAQEQVEAAEAEQTTEEGAEQEAQPDGEGVPVEEDEEPQEEQPAEAEADEDAQRQAERELEDDRKKVKKLRWIKWVALIATAVGVGITVGPAIAVSTFPWLGIGLAATGGLVGGYPFPKFEGFGPKIVNKFVKAEEQAYIQATDPIEKQRRRKRAQRLRYLAEIVSIGAYAVAGVGAGINLPWIWKIGFQQNPIKG